MLHFKRPPPSEILLLAVFVLVLAGLGFIAYLESQLTPSFTRSRPDTSLRSDGLGVFVYKIQAGYLSGISNRPTVFVVNPISNVRILTLNGRPVGAVSGTEPTDRLGQVIAVVKVDTEGPITLKATDIRSGKSAAITVWSSRNKS